MKNRLYTFAQDYARKAHIEQIKPTQSGISLPFMTHVQEVADLVWASGGSNDEKISAWLHDIVEDTSITLVDIENIFGKNIAEIVDGLTDPVDFKELPIEIRKQKQVDRLLSKSDSVKRIKIADQTSNLRLIGSDPTTVWLNNKNDALGYVKGAKKIADVCKGISPLLDNLFEEVYQLALIKHKI